MQETGFIIDAVMESLVYGFLAMGLLGVLLAIWYVIRVCWLWRQHEKVWGDRKGVRR